MPVLDGIRTPLKRGLENAYRNFERRGIDLYRSAMTDRHTFLVRWFFRFFRHVRVDTEQLETVREAAEEGTVVYVMRHRSLLDYLFFNYLFLKKQLPLARYANEINMLPILPWSLGLRTVAAKLALFFRYGWLPNPVDSGWVCEQVADGTPVLLFLKRRQTFFELLRRRRPSGGVAEELIRAQKMSEQPIKLVPLVLFWDRKPEQAKRTFWDAVFGESEQPSPIRKLVSFVRNRRRAVAAIGDPLDLKEFLSQRPKDEALDITAKRVRWMCLHYIYRERRVVTGARQTPVPVIARRIISSQPVRREIERAARKEKKAIESIEKRAEKMVFKIAADVRWNWLLAGDRILTWVWNNIYSGLDVDEEGVKKIRKVVKDHPVVLIPSHKSHADYLILSYVFYHQNLNVPYVAAGENLSFWPMGKIFRSMGAFFIRRSFRGDPLYTAVFERYVHTLVKSGQTIEFFIEGGRSRTGRVLRPRLGLLGMIVRAWAGGLAEDIHLVPINITYETVIEEREFIKELEGGSKEKESAAGLLSLWRVFTKRYGRVAVEMADPISLADHMGIAPAELADLPEAERRTRIRELGERIADDINDTAIVTAASIVAAALLSHSGRGGSMEHTLLRRSMTLLGLLRFSGARLSPRLDKDPEEALRQATYHFVKRGALRSGQEEGQTYYVVDEDQRIALDLYKNMVLHFFAPVSFLATILLAERPGDADRHLQRSELVADYRHLRHILALEFASVHEDDLPGEIDKGIEWLESASLLAMDEGDDPVVHIEPQGVETLRTLRGLVSGLLEAYLVAAKGVSGGDMMSQSALLKKIMSAGKRMYRDGFVQRREALEKPVLLNGIKYLVTAEALIRSSEEGSSEPLMELDDERRKAIASDLSRFLGAV